LAYCVHSKSSKAEGLSFANWQVPAPRTSAGACLMGWPNAQKAEGHKINLYPLIPSNLGTEWKFRFSIQTVHGKCNSSQSRGCTKCIITYWWTDGLTVFRLVTATKYCKRRTCTVSEVSSPRHNVNINVCMYITYLHMH